MEKRGRETVHVERERRTEAVRTAEGVEPTQVEYHEERTTTTHKPAKRVSKLQNKSGLLTAATIVLLATLFTIGTSWHLAGQAKEGLKEGIGGIKSKIPGLSHIPGFGQSHHEKGHFDDLGSPSLMEKAKHHLRFGRHEALQRLRDALDIEAGQPISSRDRARLEELLRLDEYSHSEGFWDRLKDTFDGSKDKTKDTLKAGKESLKSGVESGKESLKSGVESGKESLKSGMEKGQLKMEELFEKLKIEVGGKKSTSEKLREALGLESDDKPINEKAVDKLKEVLRIEKDKPISRETLDQLKEALGYKEPGLWEKAKAKLHLGRHQPTILEESASTLKEKLHDIKEKVKGVVGLGKDDADKLIEKAMDKVSESEELLSESEKLLQQAYKEHQKAAH